MTSFEAHTIPYGGTTGDDWVFVPIISPCSITFFTFTNSLCGFSIKDQNGTRTRNFGNTTRTKYDTFQLKAGEQITNLKLTKGISKEILADVNQKVTVITCVHIETDKQKFVANESGTMPVDIWDPTSSPNMFAGPKTIKEFPETKEMETFSGILTGISVKKGTLIAALMFSFHREPAAAKLTNVSYSLTSLTNIEVPPLQIDQIVMTNTSNIEQTASKTFSFTKTSTKSWSSADGWKWGGKLTIAAGIPLVANSTIEISTEESHTITNGVAETTSSTDSYTIIVKAPPNSQVTGTVSMKRNRLKVPYIGTVTYLFKTGEGDPLEQITRGEYEGVNATFVDVHFSKPILIPERVMSSSGFNLHGFDHGITRPDTEGITFSKPGIEGIKSKNVFSNDKKVLSRL